MQYTISFTVLNWNETFTSEKLSSVEATYSVKGDFEGTIKASYLMTYLCLDTENMLNTVASYTGYLTLNTEEGSVIFRENGSFAEGVSRGELLTLEGSGTGEFVGTTGMGSSQATHEGASIEIALNQVEDKVQ